MYPISWDLISKQESWIENAMKWYNSPFSVALVSVCLVAEYLYHIGVKRSFRSMILIPFIFIQARFFLIFLVAREPTIAIGIISDIMLIVAAILFSQNRDSYHRQHRGDSERRTGRYASEA
ncbi:hypothetical protein B2J88_45800 [Rhodococcus sp. SRB_17]|nr:hypothetical protein [Rhodococcus sp. SRB_17]